MREQMTKDPQDFATQEDGETPAEETYHYNADGTLSYKIDRAGRCTNYTYDLLGRCTDEVVWSPTGLILDSKSYTYDGNGNLLSDGFVTRTYDAFGRVLTQTQSGFDTITYQYDLPVNDYLDWGGGQYTESIQSDELGTVYRVYNQDGKLLFAYYNDLDTLFLEYAYTNGRCSLVYTPDYRSIHYTYNTAGQVTQILQGGGNAFSNSYTLTYTYDNKANVISEYEDYYSFESRLKTYAYDNANRLIQETNSERDTKITYEYDAVGNLLSKWTKSLQNSDEIRGAQLYAYDKNNRISSAFDGEYSYDASGNLTGDNDGRVYTYDGYDRVKTVQTSAGTIQYTYSTDNLRLSKQTADGLTRFCYDSAGNILMEKTGSTVDKIYLWGNGIEALIVPDDSDIQFYGYLKNAHGDVLTVSQGFYNYAEYDYDAYGNVVACTETGISNPIRYAGYYYDTDTQNYYLINRYYSPYQGRFLTEDTYWNVSNMLYGKFTDTVEKRVYYLAIVQSGNRFAYCGNNPIGWYDPRGLVVTEWDKENCTAWEQVQLEKFTCLWEEGYQTNNEELMSYAHYQAEQIREKRREERGLGENGSDNGNTFAPTYLSPATNYISSSEEVDLIYGYTYGTDSFHSDAFYFVADGPEIENGVTLGSVETGMARIVGDFKYGGGALGIIGADAQASITRDFIGVESGVQLVSAEISIKIPIPFTNSSVVIGGEAEAFGIGATVALDLENKKFKVGITPIVGGKLIIGLD